MELRDNFGGNGESKEEEAKEEDPKSASKSNINLLIVLGVILMLFLSVFAVKLFIKPKNITIEGMFVRTLEGKTNPETNYMYNGYAFVKVGPLWYTKWQVDEYLLNIPLHHGPLELENITAEGKLDERFNSGSYYITFEPYSEDLTSIALAAGEIGRNLVEGFAAKIKSACAANHTGCGTKPIITCENTNSSVIYIKESNESKIVMKGNCLVIEGKGEDLIKAADRVILQIYGIMK